jgi:hypothetical protein
MRNEDVRMTTLPLQSAHEPWDCPNAKGRHHFDVVRPFLYPTPEGENLRKTMLQPELVEKEWAYHRNFVCGEARYDTTCSQCFWTFMYNHMPDKAKKSYTATKQKEAIQLKSIHILNFESIDVSAIDDDAIIERITTQKTCPLKRYAYEIVFEENQKCSVRLMYETKKGGIIFTQALDRIVNDVPYEYIEVDKKEIVDSLLSSESTKIDGDWSDFL